MNFSNLIYFVVFVIIVSFFVSVAFVGDAEQDPEEYIANELNYGKIIFVISASILIVLTITIIKFREKFRIKKLDEKIATHTLTTEESDLINLLKKQDGLTLILLDNRFEKETIELLIKRGLIKIVKNRAFLKL